MVAEILLLRFGMVDPFKHDEFRFGSCNAGSRTLSGHRGAAGHSQDLGGDVARLLGGEEAVRRGELRRLRRPPERALRTEALDLFAVHGRRDQGRPYGSRSDRV